MRRGSKTYGYSIGLFLVWIGFIWYRIDLSWVSLDGVGDLSGWEYAGYYLYENLRFLPWPDLNFENNTTFYPHGHTAVFMSWGLERDYFYAMMRFFFGTYGPYLQIYYALSVGVTSFGSYLLLKGNYGRKKAFFAALTIPYLSVYGLAKYPGHYGIAIYHWTILSIVLDFIILDNLYRFKRPSLLQMVTKGTLLILNFGLELGYVAGCALTSFVLTMTAAGYLLFLRIKELGWTRVYTGIKNAVNEWMIELRHDVLSQGMLLVSGVASFLVLPLVYQIVKEAGRHEVQSFFAGGWFAHPLRVLLPFFPILHPGNFENALQISFKESPEGFAGSSIGWFLLGLMVISLYHNRKNSLPYLPVLSFFGIVLVYHNNYFPILRIFPWFKYARVAPRFSLVLPTLATLVIMGFPNLRLRSASGRWVKQSVLLVGAFSVLGLLELGTIYSLLGRVHSHQPDPTFFSLMDTIKDTEGEALFEWPFCSAGGSGGLCPYNQSMSLWSLRKFHTKKVMGAYYARLDNKAVEPYIQSGIQGLMQQQSEGCLSKQQLQFLVYYSEHFDFAGRLIHWDLIDPKCHELMKEVFSNETVTASHAHTGYVTFYPRSKPRPTVDRPEDSLLRLALVESIPSLLRSMAKAHGGDTIYVSSDLENTYAFGLLDELKDEFKVHAIPTEWGELEGAWKDLDTDTAILVSSKELLELEAFKILASDRFYLYSSRAKSLATGYSFLQAPEDLSQDNILNHDVFQIEKHLIFTHPTNDTARISLAPQNLRSKVHFLHFGIDLKNIGKKIEYRIENGQDTIFAILLKTPIVINDILIPIDVKKSISLVVDPKGDNAFAWSYWIDPKIMSEGQPYFAQTER